MVDDLHLAWSAELVVEPDPVGAVRLTRLAAAPAPTISDAGPTPSQAGLPLVDIVLAGEGRAWSGSRYCESVVGRRMRYAGHEERADGDGWRLLRVFLADPVTGLRAEVSYRILAGRGTLRSWVRLAHEGTARVTVESVTSFLGGGLAGGLDGPDDPAELGRNLVAMEALGLVTRTANYYLRPLPIVLRAP